MAKLVLGYWPIRGLAERIRLLLEYLGLQYEEEYVYDRKKWLDEQKPVLLKASPYANLPYLRDGDQVIGESYAIMVHLAHKAGAVHLLGRNAQEQVALAEFMGFFNDMYGVFIRFCYGNSTDFEKDKAALKAELDKRLGKLQEGVLAKHAFVAGQELTLGDFIFYDFLTVYNLLFKGELAAVPALKAYHDRVDSLDKIRKYRESDRFKEQPCNNDVAQWSARKL